MHAYVIIENHMSITKSSLLFVPTQGHRQTYTTAQYVFVHETDRMKMRKLLHILHNVHTFIQNGLSGRWQNREDHKLTTAQKKNKLHAQHSKSGLTKYKKKTHNRITFHMNIMYVYTVPCTVHDTFIYVFFVFVVIVNVDFLLSCFTRQRCK